MISRSPSTFALSSSTDLNCRTVGVDAPVSGFDLLVRGAKAAYHRVNFSKKF
eukprot:CAMPEP_0180158014 /NCGR_PEP_ID=MMETSP0986-20121125/26624_1 /TAXON_ID=697907 /ORGANISM="non described non described, Strain CCMP2293" /LENGTH=51 /DNA_ID=CAMNT_0022107723 /DNA_START=26 /DNA_END=181 /DNA_ORIENTATION=-